MTISLHYDDRLADYRFEAPHPMRPERFTLAVSLMREWGLLSDADPGVATAEAALVTPTIASDEVLSTAHTREYIDVVRRASADPAHASSHGLGLGDTPAFMGMHEAAALAVGATVGAVEAVLTGDSVRAFSPAGGLHHAARDHASGFCIYNDAVAGIERALALEPGLRVAYVDIDAHHGDGVEAAFEQRPEVLTLSVHESGRYLFPGTGRADDIGRGAGIGSVVNIPLPPLAGPDCYDLAFSEIIAPAVQSYGPGLLVVQAGADSHRTDPLSHLQQTVEGYCRLVKGLIGLADRLTEGRLVVLGGGGYQPYDAVPRMWACAMALLLERGVPQRLPEGWLESARSQAGRNGTPESAPASTETMAEMGIGPDAEQLEAAIAVTRAVITEVRRASPLLGGAR